MPSDPTSLPGTQSRNTQPIFRRATQLLERFIAESIPSDLETATRLFRKSLSHREKGHPEYASCLHHLAICLQYRFDSEKSVADLDAAISHHRGALELHSIDHPNRLLSLDNLGICLGSRFDLQKLVCDLDEAISHHRVALELRPIGHPDRSTSLNNLAICLERRFNSQKSVADLDEAIAHHLAALKLHPIGHPNRSLSLDNLGICLRSRFDSQKSVADLDEAISHHRAALKLRPKGHPDRSTSLDNLAICLECRFDAQKSVADLDEAITYVRAALKLRPKGHPDRSTSLNNLGYYLGLRFESKHRATDLDEAISRHRRALKLRPVGHPERSGSLHNLAVCLRHRFDLEKTADDLDDAISYHRTAFELGPMNHLNHSISLNNLAICLQRRSELQATASDLDEAISYHRVALDLHPVGHPQRFESLCNLASCLESRFNSQRIVSDLDEAIVHRRAVLESHSSEQPKDLVLLANSLETRFKCLATFADFEKALKIRQQLQDLSITVPSEASRFGGDTSQAAHSSLSYIRMVVMTVVQDALKLIPPRLIHARSGTLCDRTAQLSNFKDSQECHQLLVSLKAHEAVQQPDIERIRTTTNKYFRYVTLSHRWGDGEPLLHDVEGRSIYTTSKNHRTKKVGLKKLRKFCRITKERGYLWAWSDTCCIDKNSSAELQEAIGSMFSWYRRSALTIVHLADIPDAAPPNILSGSVWFRRGWTLQELLAPQNLLFYSRKWSPCATSTSLNHKGDPIILQALERATGILPGQLTKFCPGMDNARSKLQWASARVTTRPEDMAYSLFGIFDLHLPVLYGEGNEKALGRLLQEIVSVSGDTSIIDWVGEASSYHSCFPATIESYWSPPSIQRMMRAIDLERFTWRARQLVNAEEAHRFYDMAIKYERKVIRGHVYDIKARGLRPLTIKSSVKLKDCSQAAYILARVWDRDLLPQTVDEDEATAAYRIIAQLSQQFGALLLEEQPRREYKRIASSCIIYACTEDPTSIAQSDFMVLSIV